MRIITAKHRAAEKHNFEEFLKGAKKSFQEKSEWGTWGKMNIFQSNVG